MGLPRTEQFHVFELTRHLPRFSMYSLISPAASLPQELPQNFVSFFISERIQRVSQQSTKQDDFFLISSIVVLVLKNSM